MSPALLFAFLIGAPAAFGAACESLSALTLPATTITKAEAVAPGAFTLPDSKPDRQTQFGRLPAFCLVTATIRPTADSEIKIEVWMPADGWNRKFMGVGNGGWSGNIPHWALATALSRGYAVAATNTGHDGGDASFAPGHPEKLVDFAYRAVHEMTVAGKQFAEAYYGAPPARAYWNGCSSGGKQGLMEAQRYPRDYDGIVAGAPANHWTHLMAGDLWPAIVTRKNPAASLPQAKLEVLHKAALAACDKLDGVEDRTLENPPRCRFDPATVQCAGEAQDNCLTVAQVEAARQIYAGARNPKTGRQVFPGMPPGSELGWSALAGPEPLGIPLSHFRHVVFNNPDWDFLSLDFDKDVALADKLDKNLIGATDPDLGKFFAHGGKLIVYHGWNDQLITPLNSIDYYNSVAAKLGGAAGISGSFRLFMAPGMNHCDGGDGPSLFDAVSAMEQWVEHGTAPDRIVASRVSAGDQVDRTRPLCPYPQVARYSGQGSTDDAANFTCAQDK